ANGGASFTVNLLGSGDTFTAQQTLAGTTTTVNAGPGGDTIQVGAVGQNVDAIAGLLIVNGNEDGDTLNVDDKDNAGASTAFLTATRIWGLGMPGSTANDLGITYAGIETLNLRLGTRVDTVNVLSTNATTAPTMETAPATSANTINVAPPAPPTNGNVNAIAGLLTVTGQSSADALNVYDKDDGSQTAVVTSNSIAGLGMRGGNAALTGISYSGVETLILGDRKSDEKSNSLDTNSGTATTVENGAGVNVVNVNDSAPGTNGNVNGIVGLRTVTGQSANDTLNVDDKDGPSAQTAILTATTLAGLGMRGGNAALTGISYSGIEALNL